MRTFYAKLNDNGNVVGVQAGQNEEFSAALLEDDPKILAWFNPPKSLSERIAEQLADTETPQQIARKLEDVINNIVNGMPLSNEAKVWADDRADRRNAVE